jgi:8-oxo-dGTP diphosphatase
MQADSPALREQIYTEIRSLAPCDDLEREDQQDVLRWIESGAQLWRLMKPATPPKHLISYFAVVDDDHILLVNHRAAGRWLPAGGHVEPGEHPRATVSREALEELGLEAEFLNDGQPLLISLTHTVGATAGHVDVSLWYVLKGSRTQPVLFAESEFTEVNWFPFAEVPFDRADPQLRRFLHKLQICRTLPLSARS